MDGPRREAITEAFIRLFEDGTIYRVNRIVNWDVQLRTAVSNLEVESLELKGCTKLSVPGYDRKIGFGVMTQFQYEVDGSDEKLEIATTRPETLLGDSGMAVNPQDDRYRHLVGKNVRHPFITDRLLLIVADDHVDRELGIGLVKITLHTTNMISTLEDATTLNLSTSSMTTVRLTITPVHSKARNDGTLL